MGLDIVELVMEVEDSFDVKISNDQAQEVETVGDLFEIVKSQIALAPAGKCLSASTFYDIREGLDAIGISDRFGPSTRLDEIIPSQNRRSLWSSLSGRMQLELPKLVRPEAVVTLSTAFTLIVSLTLAWLASYNDTGFAFITTGIACLISFGILTSWATSPLATRFANDLTDFRALSKRVLALNGETQRKKHGAMGSSDLWVLLCELIVEQLGVDRDEVTPEASFVKDLGCG